VAAILDAHPCCTILQGYHEEKTTEKFLEKRRQQTAYKRREGFPYGFEIEGQGCEGKSLYAIGHTNTTHAAPTFGLREHSIVMVRHPKIVIEHRYRKIRYRTESNDHLGDAIDDFESRLDEGKPRPYYIWLEDLVEYPEQQIEDLCLSLELPLDDEWLERSAAIVKPMPEREFDLMPTWEAEHERRLQELIWNEELFYPYRMMTRNNAEGRLT
jgi:hypothetical protein